MKRGARQRLGAGGARQIVWLALGRAGAALLTAATVVLVARRLPLRQFADYALLQALAGMFIVLADLGQGLLLSDDISREPRATRPAAFHVGRKRVFLSCLSWSLITAAFLAAGGGSLGMRLTLSAIFFIYLVSDTVVDTCEIAFRSLRRSGIDSFEAVACRLLILAATAFVLWHGGGIESVIWVLGSIELLDAVIMSLALRRIAPSDVKAIRPSSYSIRSSKWLLGTNVVGTVYERLDTWILALMSSSGAVALYSAAYRILGAVLLIAGACASLTVALTSGADGRELRTSLRWLAFIGVATTAPLCAAVLLWPHAILVMLFGARYASAALPLRVLMVSALPTAAGAVILPRVTLLSGKSVTAVLVGTVMINVILNVVLIPVWGPTGAATATVVCQGGLYGGVWWIFRHKVGYESPGS